MWRSVCYYRLVISVLIACCLNLRINSTVEIVEHKEAFRTTNALEIMRKYPWFWKYILDWFYALFSNVHFHDWVRILDMTLLLMLQTMFPVDIWSVTAVLSWERSDVIFLILFPMDFFIYFFLPPDSPLNKTSRYS